MNVYFLHVKSSVDDIIWNSVQNKLEHVGQALDGEDRAMEMSGIRTMPERGELLPLLTCFDLIDRLGLYLNLLKVRWVLVF